MRIYDDPDEGHTFWECDYCGSEYNTEEEADECADSGCDDDDDDVDYDEEDCYCGSE
jgi:hypothetical protein